MSTTPAHNYESLCKTTLQHCQACKCFTWHWVYGEGLLGECTICHPITEIRTCTQHPHGPATHSLQKLIIIDQTPKWVCLGVDEPLALHPQTFQKMPSRFIGTALFIYSQVFSGRGNFLSQQSHNLIALRSHNFRRTRFNGEPNQRFSV